MVSGNTFNPAVLTSSRNPLLKDIRRAVARGTLTDQGMAVAESFHLLEEALRSNLEVSHVLFAASLRSMIEDKVRGLAGTRGLALDDRLFREVSSTESSQGIIALVRPRVWSLDQLFGRNPLVVILDGVQDPGNAGAIVRAAEAFGATGAVFLEGTVSPYSPKTLRASAGSLFRLPAVHGFDRALVRKAIADRRLQIYIAAPRGTAILTEARLTHGCALVMGSEARGASEQLRSGAVELRIPTTTVESLNVAMAAGIILYEASRQRQLRT
jgi:TrmH family RNA methyltransferase